jgi:hypothetical protein
VRHEAISTSQQGFHAMQWPKPEIATKTASLVQSNRLCWFSRNDVLEVIVILKNSFITIARSRRSELFSKKKILCVLRAFVGKEKLQRQVLSCFYISIRGIAKSNKTLITQKVVFINSSLPHSQKKGCPFETAFLSNKF